MSYSSKYLDERKFKKSKRYARVSGVCAGLANYYQWPRWGVRAATVIVFLFVPLAVLVGYFAAALILDNE